MTDDVRVPAPNGPTPDEQPSEIDEPTDPVLTDEDPADVQHEPTEQD